MKRLWIGLAAFLLLAHLCGCGKEDNAKDPPLDKAHLPTISPPSGTHIGSLLITVTTATQGASLVYTTDGSDPKETAPVNGTVVNQESVTILVSSTTTIKAIAFKQGMVTSPIATSTYEIGFASIPDTGQDACYNSSGTEIPCAGTGQDGDYSLNPPSYQDNGDGTVKDLVTGLHWQKDPAPDLSWEEAKTYCSNLTLSMKTGWRLPTRRELVGIQSAKVGTISAPPPFSSRDGSCWSSQVNVEYTDRAWYANMSLGYCFTTMQTQPLMARCVNNQ